MFDRRTSSFKYLGAYVFDMELSDEDKVIEIQINPEFNLWDAKKTAKHYGEIIGRMPKALREDV